MVEAVCARAHVCSIRELMNNTVTKSFLLSLNLKRVFPLRESASPHRSRRSSLSRASRRETHSHAISLYTKILL